MNKLALSALVVGLGLSAGAFSATYTYSDPVTGFFGGLVNTATSPLGYGYYGNRYVAPSSVVRYNVINGDRYVIRNSPRGTYITDTTTGGPTYQVRYITNGTADIYNNGGFERMQYKMYYY